MPLTPKKKKKPTLDSPQKLCIFCEGGRIYDFSTNPSLLLIWEADMNYRASKKKKFFLFGKWIKAFLGGKRERANGWAEADKKEKLKKKVAAVYGHRFRFYFQPLATFKKDFLKHVVFFYLFPWARYEHALYIISPQAIIKQRSLLSLIIRASFFPFSWEPPIPAVASSRKGDSSSFFFAMNEGLGGEKPWLIKASLRYILFHPTRDCFSEGDSDWRASLQHHAKRTLVSLRKKAKKKQGKGKTDLQL